MGSERTVKIDAILPLSGKALRKAKDLGLLSQRVIPFLRGLTPYLDGCVEGKDYLVLESRTPKEDNRG